MSSRSLVVGLGEVLWDMLPAGKQLGGAPANFAYHANALVAHGAVVSRVGDDELGREILARLDALGVDRTHVSTDPDHPTGTVDVRLDDAGVPDYVIHDGVAWDFLQLASWGPGTPAPTPFASARSRSALPLRARAIGAFAAIAPPTCLHVFDINLRQQFFSPELIEQGLGANCVLKLNDAELPIVCELLGVKGPDPREQARALAHRYSLYLVALTRGPRGSLLVCRDGQVCDHPGSPVSNIVDTVGAGDAFTAALVIGLLANRDLDRINEGANRLAAYVCTQAGATPPIPKELIVEVTAC